MLFCSSQIPLVEQHYSAEFLPFLKPTYKVERVSGDSQLKISFTDTVRKNDVIICTAQILENYLERSRAGEDEGVNLSGMTFRRFPRSLLSQNRVGGSAQLILVWLFSRRDRESSKLSRLKLTAIGRRSGTRGGLLIPPLRIPDTGLSKSPGSAVCSGWRSPVQGGRSRSAQHMLFVKTPASVSFLFLFFPPVFQGTRLFKPSACG